MFGVEEIKVVKSAEETFLGTENKSETIKTEVFDLVHNNNFVQPCEYLNW